MAGRHGNKGVISRLVLRLDGFVSADAPYGGGTLTTVPIVFEGRRLELNVETSVAGEVRVGATCFRFKPDGTAFEACSGSASGFGLALSDWGDRFLVTNQQHALYVAPLAHRYLARNPYNCAFLSVKRILPAFFAASCASNSSSVISLG